MMRLSSCRFYSLKRATTKMVEYEWPPTQTSKSSEGPLIVPLRVLAMDLGMFIKAAVK